MGIAPLVIILLILKPASADARLSAAVGQPMAVIDDAGTTHEGVLVSASAASLTMNLSNGQQVLAKSTIVSAERLRDGTGDGVVKGLLAGVLIGFFGGYAVEADGGHGGNVFVGSVAAFGAMGWALDNAQINRQTIYRSSGKARPAPAAVKLSLRF